LRAILTLAAALATLSLTACTAEQVYDRCMSNANTTYDSYKRQTEPRQK